MSFDWTKYANASGEFAKWDNPGDTVTGHIVAIREHTFDQEKGPVPLIDLETQDGSNVTLVVDKVDLRREIPLLNPQVGDKLRVTFREEVKTPNGRKKVFDIQHRAGDRPVDEPARDEPPAEMEYSEEPF